MIKNLQHINVYIKLFKILSKKLNFKKVPQKDKNVNNNATESSLRKIVIEMIKDSFSEKNDKILEEKLRKFSSEDKKEYLRIRYLNNAKLISEFCVNSILPEVAPKRCLEKILNPKEEIDDLSVDCACYILNNMGKYLFNKNQEKKEINEKKNQEFEEFSLEELTHYVSSLQPFINSRNISLKSQQQIKELNESNNRNWSYKPKPDYYQQKQMRPQIVYIQKSQNINSSPFISNSNENPKAIILNNFNIKNISNHENLDNNLTKSMRFESEKVDYK